MSYDLPESYRRFSFPGGGRDVRLERTSRRRPKEIIRSAAADGNGVTGNFCDGHSGDRQLHSLLVLGANLGITDVRTGDRGFRAVLEAAQIGRASCRERVCKYV